MNKIADGESLFESSDKDVLLLREHAQESWLPLASATQLAESKAKDAARCGAAGKEEGNASSLAMVRPIIIPEAKSMIKESDEFKNRKRKNVDAKDWIDGLRRNEATLASDHNAMADAKDANEEELNRC